MLQLRIMQHSHGANTTGLHPLPEHPQPVLLITKKQQREAFEKLLLAEVCENRASARGLFPISTRLFVI